MLHDDTDDVRFDGRALLAHLSREEMRMLPRSPGHAHDWRPPYDATSLPVRTLRCCACAFPHPC